MKKNYIIKINFIKYCKYKGIFEIYKNIFFYINILISIKVIFAKKFIDIKKLSLNDNYFVILDTGLYLYDINTFNCASIYIFNDEYKNSRDVVLIKEFHYKYKAFIICLINEYLFLFNEYTYKVENFKINEIANFKNCYYDLMPYKIEGGNIGFIVAFNNEPKTLLFYFYNFNFIEGLNMQKAIPFMNMNIKNKMIRCQINSYYTFIICFYYSKINFLMRKIIFVRQFLM